MAGLHFDGFDWDEGNVAKCQSHGMTPAEVESIFAGTPLVGPISARYMHAKEARKYDQEQG